MLLQVDFLRRSFSEPELKASIAEGMLDDPSGLLGMEQTDGKEAGATRRSMAEDRVDSLVKELAAVQSQLEMYR